RGKVDIDLSLAAIEASFRRALTRVHRNWLVNLDLVTEIEREFGRGGAAHRRSGRPAGRRLARSRERRSRSFASESGARRTQERPSARRHFPTLSQPCSPP